MKYTTYLTISDDSGKYKLDALYYVKKNSYGMPHIQIGELSIDNPEYFLDTLIPFLKGKYDKMEVFEDLQLLKDNIPKGDRRILLGIIKKGKKLGFFKED